MWNSSLSDSDDESSLTSPFPFSCYRISATELAGTSSAVKNLILPIFNSFLLIKTYKTYLATDKRQNFLNQTFRRFIFLFPQDSWRYIYVPLIFSHIKRLLIIKKKPNLFFYILNTLKRVEKNYQAYIKISNNFLWTSILQTCHS